MKKKFLKRKIAEKNFWKKILRKKFSAAEGRRKKNGFLGEKIGGIFFSRLWGVVMEIFFATMGGGGVVFNKAHGK